MLNIVKKVEVKKIVITGNDIEQLKNLCEIMESAAQLVINSEPNKLIKVQNNINFCRNILREFK